jgi:hypothetical protein
MLVKKNTIRAIPLMVLLTIVVPACKDKNNNSGSEIPNVYVNFYLQPDGIDFIPTQGYKYYNDEGYRGIIIYRVDQFIFSAYERTCSYDAQNECARVQVDNSGVLMVDSCCMSYFNILDGMPAGGPATLPLKQYFTEFDGGTLHVYNTP